MTLRSHATLVVSILATCLASAARPAPPGHATVGLPPAFSEKALTLPAGSTPFRVTRGLLELTRRAQLARLSKGAITEAPQKIQGVRRIPVVTAYFRESAIPPYPATLLQQELFDGPWPTGTLSDYYYEVSAGSLVLTGVVQPWAPLAHESSYYEGDDFLNPQSQEVEPCHGACSNNKIHELIAEALATPENTAVDWGQFDNDGPDNIPNSGDDDGFVDFIAFVHSENGGECETPGNKNTWSHTSSLSSSPSGAYVTASPRLGGGYIAIDDFTIQPSLDCSGKQMIQIGVFAHELGHSFGLPDLYDTDASNGDSAGVGFWCLMSAGSWGGNGLTPERPAHLSPWAKDFLGWVEVTDVTLDEPSAVLADIGATHTARRLRISPTTYYLVANVDRTGFNDNLRAAGLQIWKIDESVVQNTLTTNLVNADAQHRGVELIEADNNKSLDNPNNQGEPGDVFPGTTTNRAFDASTDPASAGGVAVCSIPDAAAQMPVKLLISSNGCGASPP